MAALQPNLARIAAVLLLAALMYSVHFSGSYTSHAAQIALGWSCVVVLFLMHWSGVAERQPWRILFLLLSGFLSLRYLVWRAFDTLIYTGPGDWVAMCILFGAELYAISIHFMGLFVNVWPLERAVPALPTDPLLLPTVDVFIPTYNEADDIVRATVTAATQLDYPKSRLAIYIIDDGGTQNKRNHPGNGMDAWDRHYRMMRMARELGVGYLTRETNSHAKAGNLNHALDFSSGELFLVLDCDHVPTSDFLQATVGHFIADPKLFLVQTPHFFINPCPVEKNVEGIANPSAESDMFYRTIHPAMDFWDASYFCGSAALLRRSCIEEVGGICGNTITEDAETAFLLHSRGYHSVYVNRPMVCGLSPESFDDYVIQRSRWAQGMLQMAILNNPLKTRGLSIPQRIVYFNASFFWFFSFARFIYFIAPAAFLALGLNVYDASWMQIMAYAFPFVVSTFVVMDFIYKGTRQPFFSEIYESVQALFLIPAVISVLRQPRKPAFKVTPKGLTNDRNFLSPLSAPFFVVIGVNLVALGLAAYKWATDPVLRDVVLVTGVWCVYNAFLALISLGAFWERRQVRKAHRISASGAVTVRVPRMDQSLSGQVLDVSLTGIGFELWPTFPIAKNERVLLQVSDSYGRQYQFESRIPYSIPKGGGKFFCGAEFIPELVSYADTVSYVYGDSARWRENWERKSRSSGTVRMLLQFLALGARGIQNSLLRYTGQALRALWRGALRCLATPLLRDSALGMGAWGAYRFYRALMWLVETIEGKPMRSFSRLDAEGSVRAHFPGHNAKLIGTVSDVSLTGVGILLDLPFALKPLEPVTVTLGGNGGREYQFACLIRRSFVRNGRTLCGAEFIIDMDSFPNIMHYVYGDSLGRVLLRRGRARPASR